MSFFFAKIIHITWTPLWIWNNLPQILSILRRCPECIFHGSKSRSNLICLTAKGETCFVPNTPLVVYCYLQGIQITATTPTASAVRLETEAIDLEVSNRVQMASETNHHIGKVQLNKVMSNLFCESVLKGILNSWLVLKGRLNHESVLNGRPNCESVLKGRLNSESVLKGRHYIWKTAVVE